MVSVPVVNPGVGGVQWSTGGGVQWSTGGGSTVRTVVTTSCCCGCGLGGFGSAGGLGGGPFINGGWGKKREEPGFFSPHPAGIAPPGGGTTPPTPPGGNFPRP